MNNVSNSYSNEKTEEFNRTKYRKKILKNEPIDQPKRI